MLTKDELSQAACNGKDVDIFFPEGTYNDIDNSTRYAKAICATCPVKDACLKDALKNELDYGIWGGTTPAERRAIKINRRR